MASRPAAAGDDIVRIAARAHERDRYLAALLAPKAARSDLIALAAFAGEIGRIPAFVTEPMMGRIRLQWWRERLESGTSGGHPVADAILATMARHKLSVEQLMPPIEAHEDSLPTRPFADDAALLHYLDRIDGTLFDIAARIVGVRIDQSFIENAARAYGFSRLLLEVPATRAHGRLLVPVSRLADQPLIDEQQLRIAAADLATLARAHLQACVDALQQLPRSSRAPFLPLALVHPHLQLNTSAQRSTAAALEVNPLRRVWRLLHCSWTGRL